jgi:hypothetical protein
MVTEVQVSYTARNKSASPTLRKVYPPPAQSRAGVLTEARFFHGSTLFAASHLGGRPL